MNKTLSNQKKKLTTIKNQVLKARDFHLEAENRSNTEVILTALKSDKKSFKVNYEENGEMRSYLYDHVDMIDSISPYPLVSNFIESKTSENYQLLLNGCFCSVMADMASAKYLAKGGSNFDTDICLNILFALAYLDDTYEDVIQAGDEVVEYFFEYEFGLASKEPRNKVAFLELVKDILVSYLSILD